MTFLEFKTRSFPMEQVFVFFSLCHLAYKKTSGFPLSNYGIWWLFYWGKYIIFRIHGQLFKAPLWLTTGHFILSLSSFETMAFNSGLLLASLKYKFNRSPLPSISKVWKIYLILVTVCCSTLSRALRTYAKNVLVKKWEIQKDIQRNWRKKLISY